MITLLDTREFDHPLPLEKVVEAFRVLQGSEVIHMIHRREPVPLFEILIRNGGFYRCVQDDAGVWHIFITRDATIVLEDYHV